MAKLFGEYLVERNLATVEQLLDALIEQLRSVPSTAEVIYELNLMKKVDLLSIFAHQQYTGSDFRSSAQSLGLWGNQLAEKVTAHLQNLRRPLGEILVGRGHISLDSLTAALDSYVEWCSSLGKNLKPTSAVPKPVQLPQISDKSTSAISQAISGEESLDPILVKEFVDVYESQIRPSIQELIKAMGSTAGTKSQLREYLNGALSEFIGLRAAAQFLGAKRCETIAAETVQSLEKIVKSEKLLNQRLLLEILKISSHIIDSLSEILKDFNSDSHLDGDSNMIDLIERLSKLNRSLGTEEGRRLT